VNLQRSRGPSQRILLACDDLLPVPCGASSGIRPQWWRPSAECWDAIRQQVGIKAFTDRSRLYRRDLRVEAATTKQDFWRTFINCGDEELVAPSVLNCRVFNAANGPRVRLAARLINRLLSGRSVRV